MKKSLFCFVCFALVFSGVVFGWYMVSDKPASDEPVVAKPTGIHQSAKTISLDTGGQKVPIRTFCVDKKGRLLIATGGAQTVSGMQAVLQSLRNNASEETVTASIHVFDADGKAVTVWNIEVTPEALAVGPDNSVYAAGMGKVVHLDETGKVLTTIESPHMAAQPMSRSVRSIAVTDKYVFLCTPEPKGFAGSEVWRLDADFSNPKVIVKNLRGCCGQMNISAVGDKLVIPENARFKVHFHDAEGTQLQSWGDKEDNDPVAGFGACCNPMNVAFDGEGNVLTSEASVGAVKRFKQDGTFIEQVALSEIVPGCKHTPIGMSLDGKKVYILDIDRRNIIVMEQE